MGLKKSLPSWLYEGGKIAHETTTQHDKQSWLQSRPAPHSLTHAESAGLPPRTFNRVICHLIFILLKKNIKKEWVDVSIATTQSLSNI